MVALAAWQLPLLLLGTCAGSAGFDEPGEQAAALYQAGRFAEAEPVAKQALEQAEQWHGPDHPTVGSALNTLAAVYLKQGRYAEAEPLAGAHNHYAERS
jgi:tetratricopeptide (TPR) repeat protein